MDSEKKDYFDNLSVEGWFWELVRRDDRFRKRFGQMEQAAEAYCASRLGQEEYARVLKNYLAHISRYGIQVVSLPGDETTSKSNAYLLLPLPGKDKVIAVPRPDLSYRDFEEGHRPAPRKIDLPKTRYSRARIRKLLVKYDLLEKRTPPDSLP
jgi:hypothetical protein